MAPVLGYWDARSLGQPIRNLLIYKGVEFEDKRYKIEPTHDFFREWLKEKFTLGLKYPNLPYYIDGDVKITQSLAILRYLGRKHDLAARNDEETIELDMLEQRVRDFYLMLPCSGALVAKLNYSLKTYAEEIDDFLSPWDEFLADRKWVMGDRMTYVDFLLYEGLDWHREFRPEAVQRWPNIVRYLERFEELPNIKEYFASDKYKKWPILGPLRPWGYNKPSDGSENKLSA
uniref:glutathione transferase n=1 Tax=Amblyomma maculatum TaxID=34609 RepID=G3MSC2_AMBMU